MKYTVLQCFQYFLFVFDGIDKHFKLGVCYTGALSTFVRGAQISSGDPQEGSLNLECVYRVTQKMSHSALKLKSVL